MMPLKLVSLKNILTPVEGVCMREGKTNETAVDQTR
jgi:uncharacterized protein YbcI